MNVPIQSDFLISWKNWDLFFRLRSQILLLFQVNQSLRLLILEFFDLYSELDQPILREVIFSFSVSLEKPYLLTLAQRQE